MTSCHKEFLKKVLIIFILVPFSLKGQPNSKDFLRVALELGVFSYSQFIYHPDKKVSEYNAPNKVDAIVRNSLRWNKIKSVDAKNMSDFLLYGVFIGVIPASTIYLNNFNLFLINLEILSVNGLITNIVKYGVGRQRPYSHFGTKNNDKESFKSFFSGHTSTAFAIGTSTAKILDNYTQLNSKTIWTTSLGLATLTGYFRIAADKHYFTDIIAGAMVGTLVGYLGFDALHDKYVGTKNSKPKYFPKFSCSPNNINLTLKL